MKALLWLLLVIGSLTAQNGVMQGQDLPQDSLTVRLCDHDEQIFTQRTSEWRIEYYMGETHLNMKTMSGFLSLNGASKPVYNRYLFEKYAGWALFFTGVGLLVADGRWIDGNGPWVAFGGIGVSVSGIVMGFRSNETFRKAIWTYNKNLCKIK